VQDDEDGKYAVENKGCDFKITQGFNDINLPNASHERVSFEGGEIGFSQYACILKD
jgi:hypothetical protein